MKKTIIFLLSFAICSTTFAQNDKYTAAMEKAVAQTDTARNLEGFKAAGNMFERIANAEQEQWLPFYYHAFCQVRQAIIVMNDGDGKATVPYLDKAQESIDIAQKLSPNNSEIVTMQGYIYQGRIWENPMTKGAKYGPKSGGVLDKAIELNPENPRAYYVKGQGIFYTPAFFGGGADNARPLLEKAKELYDKEERENALSPAWGSYYNNYLLEEANK